MTRFWLYRWRDASGISGTGIVAEGVVFEGGQVAMRWLKSGSLGIYVDLQQVREIHGHGGDTEVVELTDMFERGTRNAALDHMENAPFASVGEPKLRLALVAPDQVQGRVDTTEFLRGYRHQARVMYGDDWQTCSFGWRPALTIEK